MINYEGTKMSIKKEKKMISIIIPIEHKTAYLVEALDCLSKQTYQNFEVFVTSSVEFSIPYSFARVVVNQKLAGDVAAKRNEVSKYGTGEIFVFNDDDVLTPTQYLENIVKKFKNPNVFAAAGPLLTPPNSHFMQKASGAVWESYLGMGGLGGGIHRSLRRPAHIVYDYPAANLIIRREIFEDIGGYQPGLYPGEDTKLCLDIFNKYNKGVNYDPNLFVYHHRKPLFKAYLNQIGRYGTQRGWFALSYPETSFKLLYFIPALFLLYLIFIPVLAIVNSTLVLPLLIYLILIILEGGLIMLRKGPRIAVIASLGIIATHLYYGYKFLAGFVSKLRQKMVQLTRLIQKL